MKKKSVIMLIVLAFVFTSGVTVFASIADNNNDGDAIAFGFKKCGKQECTKEEKAELEARRLAQKAKWDALTPEQKEELFILKDQTIDAHIAFIEKCAEYGLIEADKAQTIKEKIIESKTHMREKGMYEKEDFKMKKK